MMSLWRFNVAAMRNRAAECRREAYHEPDLFKVFEWLASAASADANADQLTKKIEEAEKSP
jgi:hypothetical protein